MSLRRKDTNGRLPRLVRGQATIEFALVMTLLLVPLLVGLADVARIYGEQLAVVNAAKVAARWVTLSPRQQACTEFDSVEDVVQKDLNPNPGRQRIQVEGINVNPEPDPPISDAPAVEVRITYKHTLLMGAGGSVIFVGKATMLGTPSTPAPPSECIGNS